MLAVQCSAGVCVRGAEAALCCPGVCVVVWVGVGGRGGGCIATAWLALSRLQSRSSTGHDFPLIIGGSSHRGLCCAVLARNERGLPTQRTAACTEGRACVRRPHQAATASGIAWTHAFHASMRMAMGAWAGVCAAAPR